MANAFQSDAFQDGSFQDSTGLLNLVVPLLDGAPTVYAPTLVALATTLVLPLLDGAPTVYAPAVLQTPARVTQAIVEVLDRADNATVFVTQAVVEVVALPDNAQVFVTQAVIEVLRRAGPDGGAQVIIVGE